MEYLWIVGSIIVSTVIIVIVQITTRDYLINNAIEFARALQPKLDSIYSAVEKLKPDPPSVQEWRVDEETDEFILDGERINRTDFYVGLYTFLQKQRLHIKERQEKRND